MTIMTINNLFRAKELEEFLAAHHVGDLYWDKIITRIEVKPEKLRDPNVPEELMTFVITHLGEESDLGAQAQFDQTARPMPQPQS